MYALIALGYTMVYGILKLLNFAHGEVFMFGAFAGYGVLDLARRAGEPGRPGGRRCSSSCSRAAMAVSGFLGVAVERFAYRPLRNAPRIAPLIRALGVSFFLQNVACSCSAPTSAPTTPRTRSGQVMACTSGPASTSGSCGSSSSCRRWTDGRRSCCSWAHQLGRAMRATSFDREAASMMGVDVDRVIV